MSSIIFDNNDITKIKYNGYTIAKVYACGGELVYTGDTSSDSIGKIKFQTTVRSSDTATTSCVTSFKDVSTRFRPNVFEFTISADTVCGLQANISGANVRKIQSVSLPESTKIVDYNAFYLNNNYDSGSYDGTVIVLNDGLEYIRTNAFEGIVNNTENLCPTLVIPSSVKEIESNAFNFDNASFGSTPNASRRGWYTVIFKGSTPPTMGTIFGSNGGVQMNRQIVLLVPSGSSTAYRNALPAVYNNSADPMSIVEYTTEDDRYSYAMSTFNDYRTSQNI